MGRVQQQLMMICEGSAACLAVMLLASRLEEEKAASRGKLAGRHAATDVNSSTAVGVLWSTKRLCYYLLRCKCS
jgi:hypothetical protein